MQTSSQFRSLLLLLPLALPLLWAGCRCPSAKPSRKAAVRPAASKATRPAPVLGSQAMRRIMRGLQVDMGELRRRAQRGQLGKAPTLVLLAKIKRLPTRGVPKSFIAGLTDLRGKASKLLTTKQPRDDFGLVVESCVSCHRELAPREVSKVELLRLPAAGEGSAR